MVTWLVGLSVLAAGAAQCRAAYDEVRYRDAIRECRAAIAAQPKEHLAELYRLLALSLAAQGDHAQAQRAFVSLLALDPAATLSDSYAPRIRADFDSARREGGGAPIGLSFAPAAPALTDRPLVVEVRVADGPAQPVTDISVASGAFSKSFRRGEPLQATLPPAAEAGTRAVSLAAFDAFGGKLASLEGTLEVTAPRRRPLLLTWWLWGAAGGAVGAGGGVLGALSRSDGNASRAALYGDTGLALQQRANREAVSADICLGVAGALGAWALALLLTSGGDGG